MAGNNLIKLLRCTSTTRANSTEILLNGQPLVEQDTHLMYVGDGVTEAKNLTPYGGGGGKDMFLHCITITANGDTGILYAVINLTCSSPVEIMSKDHLLELFIWGNYNTLVATGVFAYEDGGEGYPVVYVRASVADDELFLGHLSFSGSSFDPTPPIEISMSDLNGLTFEDVTTLM